jgi:hypothetical protein
MDILVFLFFIFYFYKKKDHMHFGAEGTWIPHLSIREFTLYIYKIRHLEM